MILVILLRLVLPGYLIPRHPLFGGIIAVLLDIIDLRLLEVLNGGDLSKYQSLDKILDLYYLSLEASVALTWKNIWARYITLVLFIARLVGVLLFELAKVPFILVVFPNLFESFFLIYLLQLKLFKKDLLHTRKRVLVTLMILLLPKLLHEYFLHVNTAHPWEENKYVKAILKLHF